MLLPVAAASTPRDLFSRAELGTRSPTLRGHVVRATPVHVDLALLGSLQPGETVNLNVTPGLAFVGVVDQVLWRQDRRFTVSGSLERAAFGSFMIVVEDDVAAATIRVPTQDRLFELRYLGNGVHLVADIDSSRYLPEAPPISNGLAVPPESEPATSPTGDDERQGSGGTTSYAACGRPAPVFDVLVVYTTLARDQAGGTNAIHALCQLAIDENNRIYANSGIDARMRLVYRGWVDYDENGTNQEHLDRLEASNDGNMDGVHTLRDAYGADFVSLLVDDPNTPGIGNCIADAGRAFSVVNWSYITGRFTLTHEIGHNLGCGHNREDASSFCQLHSYSYGWYFTGNSGTDHGTVMSYVGTRIPFYSNPGVSFDGQPTGVRIGETDEAFNARTIGLRRSAAEGFRGTVFEKWVDFDALPLGFGTFDLPYNTFATGVAETFHTPAGSPVPELWIKTGSTTETLRITKPMKLRVCGGDVRIGVAP